MPKPQKYMATAERRQNIHALRKDIHGFALMIYAFGDDIHGFAEICASHNVGRGLPDAPSSLNIK